LLYGFSSKRWQVIKQMAILLKDSPKHIGHGEHNTCIRDIWKVSVRRKHTVYRIEELNPQLAGASHISNRSKLTLPGGN
jgi:hypothetical protein